MSASISRPDRLGETSVDPPATGGGGPPDPATQRGVSPVPAAVLVPLFLAGEPAEPHLVLTRRRSDLRRHAGEISFPGGRRDAGDTSLRETALREAEEEIGLPRGSARPLAELAPTETFVTGYVIHPFVAEIPAGIAWRLSPREVEEVLELPLEEVAASRTTTAIERRGISFRTFAYVVDEHVIWGATARIIENLLAARELLEGLAARD